MQADTEANLHGCICIFAYFRCRSAYDACLHVWTGTHS
jgi:hypothetical protein